MDRPPCCLSGREGRGAVCKADDGIGGPPHRVQGEDKDGRPRTSWGAHQEGQVHTRNGDCGIGLTTHGRRGSEDGTVYFDLGRRHRGLFRRSGPSPGGPPGWSAGRDCEAVGQHRDEHQTEGEEAGGRRRQVTAGQARPSWRLGMTGDDRQQEGRGAEPGRLGRLGHTPLQGRSPCTRQL